MKDKGHIKLICEALLFITFILCTLFIVLIGSGVLESITGRSDRSYQNIIAKQYIINKIHESDKEDTIDVIELEGQNVIKINISNSNYSTYIYYKDGLRELVADLNDGLGLSDGIKILDCKEFEITKEDNIISIDNTKISVRSNDIS